MIAFNDNDTLVEIGGKVTSMYGTCSTSSDTAEKAVTISNLSQIDTGATIRVKFTNANTAADPTLNVNNLGAKPIYTSGTVSSGKLWEADSVVQLTYDGSAWMLISSGSGESSLAELTDTNIDNPTEAQPLTYDSASGKWVNGGDSIPTAYGGTGNSWGYIRTGQLAGTTVGRYATIEGSSNTGSGMYAHVEGGNNVASGRYTHAGGLDNTAAYDFQTTVGKHNNNKSGTLLEVGNGESNLAKSNAFEVYSDGKISCDDGTSKFKFTQVDGEDGYYDASGTFHPFSSGVEDPLSTAHGGTGNTDGYIRTGTSSPAGTAATVEGTNNVGSGSNSHVEGSYNQTGANATNSHVSGYANVSSYANQTVVGVANNNKSDTYFEVGNGSKNGQHKNAFEVYSNGNATVQGNLTVGGSISNSNGTLNAVVANPSDTASTNLTKIKIGSTAYNISGGGGGSTVTKTNYVVEWSSWSSTTDSSGFYTTTFTVSPTLDTSVPPNIYVSGGGAAFQPSDADLTRFSYVKRARLNGTTMTLYATSKPNANMQIYVEGVAGSGSGDTMVNVVMPNKESNGGGGLPEDPLSTAHGGTGNADGFIRTGQKSSATAGTGATAEGNQNSATGNYSHAEGRYTTASGTDAHSEGYNTLASGSYSHAGGNNTTASGVSSLTSGYYTTAGYSYQTALGKYNSNKSDTLLEVGNGTSSSARSNAFAVYSDGKISQDNGSTKFKFGNNGTADGYYDASDNFHTFGSGGDVPIATTTTPGKVKPDGSTITITSDGTISASGGGLPENPLAINHGGTGNSDGYIRTGQKANTTIGTRATAEGYEATASGERSHAEGDTCVSSGSASHAEGYHTTAQGPYSHAEGANTTAKSTSHAEGDGTTSANNGSHAEGSSTQALYAASHAEGSHTEARNIAAHAEGSYCVASGSASHAEGSGAVASGNISHAGGYNTVAGYSYQTVIGKYNSNKSDSYFEVGNGTTNNARSNAFEVYSDGKISCDNGSSKFQFTQSSGVDGYYDASGVFHAFGGSGVSDVSWDTTNKKLKQTKNGTTTDIVTGATILNGLTSSQVTTALGYTPPQQDTNTHRPIQVNGSQILGDNTTALNLKAGSNVTLSTNGGTVTINSSGGGSGGLPSDPLTIDHGGTGNSDGYIQTGAASGTVKGDRATIEGYTNTATGSYAHAEGYNTTSNGQSSHAEGEGTQATVEYAHAEGYRSRARGSAAHSEGFQCIADGAYSHAQGKNTYALGEGSFAGGLRTNVKADYTFAFGYQQENIGGTFGYKPYTFVVGYQGSRYGNNPKEAYFGRGTKLQNGNTDTIDAEYGAIWETASGGTTNIYIQGNSSMFLLSISMYKGQYNDLLASAIYYIAGSATGINNARALIELGRYGPADAFTVSVISYPNGTLAVTPGSSYTTNPYVGQVTRIL